MSQSETITRIHAREVLDSRGNPTVEVEIHCQSGAWGRAIVPSGASTGQHEAVELRDGDPARHGGKGVRKAVAHVKETIAPQLAGMAASEQATIDDTLCRLDGTPNKARLGANAILGVSLACAHAAAAARQQPLWQYLDPDGRARMPLPMVNLISGGLHAGGQLDLQDFLLLPIGARSYSEALEMTGAVYRALAGVLRRHGFESVLVGDEGGFGPKLRSNEQAIELILEAFQAAGLAPGRDAALALDVASTHFHRDDRYHLQVDGGAPRTAVEMVDLLRRWVDAYPVLSIEDGLAEDDWDGWKQLTAALGHRVQLIGDDLFVTNPQRLQRGINEQVANAVLVKVNQIGTLTETLRVVEMARGAGQIKIGSVARSERLAKYNQLLRIEEAMGPNAPFAAWPKEPQMNTDKHR